MSEIKREKEIADFKQFLKNHKSEMQEHTIDIDDLFDAWDKLKKIEKIIDDMLMLANSDEYRNEGYKIMLLQLTTLGKIEQIVKE